MEPISKAEFIATTKQKMALFLDFDGTLVDIAETPDNIFLRKKTVTLLENLTKTLNGAVAIVTGRPISEIDKFLNPVLLPIAGKHGAEIRNAKKQISKITGVDLVQIVEQFASFSKIHAGTFVENKGVCVALHFRGSNLTDDKVKAWVEDNIHLGSSLKCYFGKKICEIQSANFDKGYAISQLLKHAPFKERLPIFVGDDTPDEDGFNFVNKIGGLSIKVGKDSTSNAQFFTKNLNETYEWLFKLNVKFVRKTY